MGAAVVLITGATVLGAVIASVIAEERDRWQRHQRSVLGRFLGQQGEGVG